MVALGATSARAADFVVTRYDDPVPDGCLATDCSLREAILAANAFSGSADRVLLSAGEYVLSLAGAFEDSGAVGDLDVRGPVEILGPGATMTRIDGNQLDGVLHFAGTGVEYSATVRGLTITGAGGPFSAHGVNIESGAMVTIEDCEIRDNGTTGGGDGISMSFGSGLTLRRSTISGSATHGMLVTQGLATIENSTLAANASNQLNVGATSIVHCRHCTLFEDGGTGHAVLSSSALTLENSLVVGDCSTNPSGEIDSGGGNLETPGNGCGFDAEGDLDAVDTSGITSITDHGGSTRTAAVPFFSPVPDHALDAKCLPTDQRAVPRPQDGSLAQGVHCDAGAFELAPPALRPLTPILHDGFLQGDAEAWSSTSP